MIIEEIRKKLLSTNHFKKASGVKELQRQLSNAKTRKLFIIETISADIAVVLASILVLRNDDLQRSILICWEILSEDEYFYKNNVATTVIMKILETGTLIAVNQTKEQPILLTMAYTLALLFRRARIFKVSLKITKFIDQLLLFINHLNVKKSSSDQLKITVVGNLFSSIIFFIDSATICLDKFKIIQELYEDIFTAISKINKVVTQNKNKQSFERIFTTTIDICSTGVDFINEDELPLDERFHSDSDDSSTSDFNERLEISKKILNLSCEKMLEIVIPNFKKFNESNPEFQENLKNLIKFLNGLYEQEHNINYIKKFSFELSIQGYLKYFFQTIQNPNMVDIKQSICRCLARILTNLAHYNLSIQWQGDLRSFCKFIYDGLMSHVDSRKLTSDSTSSDASLFCYYFHYHATEDSQVIEIIGQMLTKKILDFSLENLPPSSILQITWFFISEWMLKSTSVDSDKCLPDALTHLIEILLKVGIEKCYMCHPALVVTVLKNPIFPREIRHQVVKLWLKTDGDVYTLVDADHRNVVVDSLIHALNTGCKNVVKRAFKDLIEIAKDTNPMNFDFMPNIWEQIFDNLITYKSENEHNFEGFLKLAEKLMTNDLSITFAMRSIVKFTTFFSCNNKVNSSIKILLITLTNKMFSILANADESIVISSTILEKNVLNEIRDQAFKSANNDLAAACLKCLANIIIILIPVSKKLSQPLIITSSELIDTLSKDLQVSTKVLGLLNNLSLNYENYKDCVVIDFRENNVNSDIYEIYDLLIEIHNKVMSIEWKTTFDCLTNFLTFVKKNYPVAIRDCCENISIHLTIIKTIDSRYVGTEFIKFVNLWLEQGIKSHCSFIDGSFELNRMKIISQDNFCFESTFEKALKHLKIYIKKLDASHSISTALLETLNLKLNIL